jgi:glutathione peroxidase
MTNHGKPSTQVSFYDLQARDIEGNIITFDRFKGKKVLLVNVASKCGYTPQYGELQQLHETFGEKVAVLGFPANNFMGQEPGTNSEIAAFCSSRYGVTFTMFEKISVKGEDMHPVYRWLTDPALNGWNDKKPGWNFCKYLVDEQGKLVKFFPSGVKPMSDELTGAIGQ